MYTNSIRACLHDGQLILALESTNHHISRPLTKTSYVVPFESVDETLVCDHSNESYWAVLSCGTICFDNFAKWNSRFFPQFWTLIALLGMKGLKPYLECFFLLFVNWINASQRCYKLHCWYWSLRQLQCK